MNREIDQLSDKLIFVLEKESMDRELRKTFRIWGE